jgi:hypothetical protein
MSDQLKPDDRMRVTDRNRVQGYEAGDKGMVQAVASIPAIGELRHYQVAMGRDGGVIGSVFSADEIELDIGPIRNLTDATILPGPGSRIALRIVWNLSRRRRHES